MSAHLSGFGEALLFRDQISGRQANHMWNLLTIRDVDGVALFMVFIVFVSSGHLRANLTRDILTLLTGNLLAFYHVNIITFLHQNILAFLHVLKVALFLLLVVAFLLCNLLAVFEGNISTLHGRNIVAVLSTRPTADWQVHKVTFPGGFCDALLNHDLLAYVFSNHLTHLFFHHHTLVLGYHLANLLLDSFTYFLVFFVALLIIFCFTLLVVLSIAHPLVLRDCHGLRDLVTFLFWSVGTLLLVVSHTIGLPGHGLVVRLAHLLVLGIALLFEFLIAMIHQFG